MADRLNRTDLHYAAKDGDNDRVRALLLDGLDPNATDANGWTPLHFAAQAWSEPVVRLLLEAGAQLDPPDDQGNTPLFRAVFESRGRGEVIILLRQAGADPTIRNQSGIAPADLARTIGNYDVAQYFADLPPAG